MLRAVACISVCVVQSRDSNTKLVVFGAVDSTGYKCMSPYYRHRFLENLLLHVDFSPCVDECMIVCAQTWFHCTFVCGVYSAVGEENSPVITPLPVVSQQLLKAISEGE